MPAAGEALMEPRVQYSPDARWFWDGAQWRPVPAPAPRPAPPPPRGLFWFFRAPEWVGPYVLMALIGLIPFVGHMVILGWMAEARDNARREWGVVPPAGFRYLERGFRIWVVQIVYTLVVLAVIAVCVGILVALVAGGAPWYSSLAAGLALGALSIALVLGAGFLFAAQVGVTDRYGIAAGITLPTCGAPPWPPQATRGGRSGHSRLALCFSSSSDSQLGSSCPSPASSSCPRPT